MGFNRVREEMREEKTTVGEWISISLLYFPRRAENGLALEEEEGSAHFCRWVSVFPGKELARISVVRSFGVIVEMIVSI